MKTKRTRRSGFTLRELSIAMAIGSAVMGVAVGLVHHAFDWSTTARNRRMDDQAFFNLSRQLRSDVHVAREAEFAPNPTSGDTLELMLADGNSIVYTVAENAVTRVETRDDTTLHRESYRFKHPRSVSLNRSESDNQVQLNVKSVTPFAQSEVPLWRSLRISVGLRLRHQNGDIDS